MPYHGNPFPPGDYQYSEAWGWRGQESPFPDADQAYLDQMQKIFGQYANTPPPRTATGMGIMHMAERERMVALYHALNSAPSVFIPSDHPQFESFCGRFLKYTGPDMNEVDAALEAIERMEA